MDGLGAVVKPMREKPGPKKPTDCKRNKQVVFDTVLPSVA